MNRASLKSAAKQQIKGNIGILFLIALVNALISFATSFIPIIGSIVGFCISPALSLGLISIYLNLTQGQKPAVADLFSKMHLWGKALWLSILIAFFTFMWSLLFVIPGIIKSYSYSMAFYVLAEHPEMSAREALNESKRITNGQKMNLFVLDLSFIGWGLLTAITFGIAGIYAAPYMNATYANAYNSIK